MDFFNLHYCLFKINEKKPSIVDFFFFHVVPKSYRTVTREPRYVPNLRTVPPLQFSDIPAVVVLTGLETKSRVLLV